MGDIVKEKENRAELFFEKEERRDRKDEERKVKMECFTQSQLDSDLCYGGYSWCDTCELYVHKDFLSGRRESK